MGPRGGADGPSAERHRRRRPARRGALLFAPPAAERFLNHRPAEGCHRNLAEHSLLLQATNLDSVITSVRSYYAINVVARVLSSPGGDQGHPQLSRCAGRHSHSGDLSLTLG